jgi:hypothetical protein
MSLGRALNQLGVSVANSAAISLEAAAELVNANWMIEEGTAVCRTW